MLWNQFKVEITVGLWSLLLFVPGIVAMVRLALTDPVAALETRHPDPLARSRELTEGHRRRIFFVLLPLGALGLAGSYLGLKWVLWSGYSRWVMALSDSLYAVGAQLATVAVLLVYLGLFSERDRFGGARRLTPPRRLGVLLDPQPPCSAQTPASTSSFAARAGYGSLPFGPTPRNGEEEVGLFRDEIRLLLQREHQVSVALFLRCESGEDSAANAEIGPPHVRALFRAGEAQRNPAKIGGIQSRRLLFLRGYRKLIVL